MHLIRRDEHQYVKDCYRSCIEAVGALDTARGKEFVIHVPSKGITTEDGKVERYFEVQQKDYSKILVGFNMLVQSMNTNAVYQNIISFNCEVGDLKGAWKAIMEKYPKNYIFPVASRGR